MRRKSLAGAERIRKRVDFDAVHQRGFRARGRFLTLLARPNEAGFARLGVAASRKLGGAVHRNRAKRLIRELFRRNKPAAAIDVVVIPRSELLEAEFKSLEADYRSTLHRCVPRDTASAVATKRGGGCGPEGASGL